MSVLAYRPDIDGLRAIAVLAVVFYHFGIGPFHGGFVGVDVFFVISGYLITGIIHKEIGRGEFTFAGFYERRIRRIFPALFVVLVFTLAMGAWLLLPSDLVRLGHGTLATLFFGSNVLFWRQSGYFDTSADYNPLLHTWSLAVEEQFYIGLPILLLALHRYARRWFEPALAAAAIASFALCLWQQAPRPKAVFFLSPFRAWELLTGALLALGWAPSLAKRALREFLSLLALAVLAGSLWWIRAGVDFPGWQAALPVGATAMLIHAGGSGDCFARRVLSWRPLVFVGLISYSLYLWHWPLRVYAHYSIGMEPLPAAASWGLAAASVVLAVASYRWVETPFRRRHWMAGRLARRPLFLGTAAAMALLMAAAFAVQVDRGWTERFPQQVAAYDAARDPEIPFLACYGVPPGSRTDCVAGDDDAERRILLWGDSYALAWAPAFDRLGQEHGFAVELAWMSECPGILGVDVSEARECRRFNDEVAARLARGGLGAVILVGSWGPYLNPNSGTRLLDGDGARGPDAFAAGLARTAERVRAAAERLVIVGPTPGAPGDIPFRLAAASAFSRTPPPGSSPESLLATGARFWQLVDPLRNDPSVVAIDPSPWFRNGHEFRYLDEQGALLYRDGGHLSVDGAYFVARRFPVEVLFAGEN